VISAFQPLHAKRITRSFAVRQPLIEAIGIRFPAGTGRGQRSVRKSRKVGGELGIQAVTLGASPDVCHALGIPAHRPSSCEDSYHRGHDDTSNALSHRLEKLLHTNALGDFEDEVHQLGR